MYTYFLAVFAAVANATSSVLQRKANREESQDENLSWRLIRGLLHRPVWFGGIAAVIAGFLLQATALGGGQLAVVEPILVLELPLTLFGAALVFRSRLHTREWGAAGGMTLGLVALLYFLSPSPGHTKGIAWYTWTIGIGATLAGIAVAILMARTGDTGSRRAALLGVATGSGFGLTAALMKGMTTEYAHGFIALFTSWPLYGMIVSGAASMFLLQSAMNAGRLLAAQPGITLSDPLVSILWGVLAFHERIRGGIYLALAALSGILIVGAVITLARSPLLHDEVDDDQAEEGPGGEAYPRPAEAGSAATRA